MHVRTPLRSSDQNKYAERVRARDCIEIRLRKSKLRGKSLQLCGALFRLWVWVLSPKKLNPGCRVSGSEASDSLLVEPILKLGVPGFNVDPWLINPLIFRSLY